MNRYFLEVAYEGNRHSGFQIQKNAPTIQGEINDSLEVLLKKKVTTYGSSRTDAGVHAHQNYLHVDLEKSVIEKKVYNINAILPSTIALKQVYLMHPEAHARFSATARSYEYVIYTRKNPFLKDYGYFFPYPLDIQKMQRVAEGLKGRSDFSSFSKRNTQVNNFFCDIQQAMWRRVGEKLVFSITSNRFLRGMVRGLVATMILVGRGKMEVKDFEVLLKRREQGTADFSAPGKGLFLEHVHYPDAIFKKNLGG